MATVEVLDSFMSYRDAGTGDIPVVFLHGNPVFSYVWRNVIPHVSGQTRCLAPDLIGMGESGQPDLAYRLADHVRYLDAWFDAMSLNDAVLVGHDWGGTLAMDWAARHPGQVASRWPRRSCGRCAGRTRAPVAGLFRAYRSPKGEQMVMEDNMVIEVNLARGVAGGLAAADLDAYRARSSPASRKPMLAWTRESRSTASPPTWLGGSRLRSLDGRDSGRAEAHHGGGGRRGTRVARRWAGLRRASPVSSRACRARRAT